MSRSLGWYWAQSQKAMRDRAAEDAYVRVEGKAEGKAEGRAEERRTLIESWYRKGRSVAEIAELLEEDEESVREICRHFSQENP